MTFNDLDLRFSRSGFVQNIKISSITPLILLRNLCTGERHSKWNAGQLASSSLTACQDILNELKCKQTGSLVPGGFPDIWRPLNLQQISRAHTWKHLASLTSPCLYSTLQKPRALAETCCSILTSSEWRKVLQKESKTRNFSGKPGRTNLSKAYRYSRLNFLTMSLGSI